MSGKQNPTDRFCGKQVMLFLVAAIRHLLVETYGKGGPVDMIFLSSHIGEETHLCVPAGISLWLG